MRHSTRRVPHRATGKRNALLAAAILAMPALALAQGTAAPSPPARETPRPQDIDPAVDTSRTTPTPQAAPARETPKPQDVNPGVDTSAPASTPAASPGNAAPASGAGSAGNSSSRKAPPNGATRTNSAAATAGAAPTAPKGKAQDRLELDTTQITGNRELPKVLYIVPWKRADLGDLVGKPVNSLLDEVLTPVDRDVFRRENRYYRALTPDASSAGGNAAPAARDER